ncbi:RHS repeat-associated core domain-containing protein [Faecalispora jeddahensis]|uniref:RHS repeat-associated core domain-containing protein n=1 Tax=Faecalispora jeddahensis TaxID=1414721 RepID=UPI00145A2DFE|nr:RHS repeat-associated core domain-containing protein [Faecalispora jeddahensis]
MTGIVDSNLNVVVEYSYDAWGKLIETTGSEANLIGKLNPFLYRGYYYDAETGLYYLNSRYYDPVTGRFLNADGLLNDTASILDVNLLCYCYNDPANMVDFDGLKGQSIWSFKSDTAGRTILAWYLYGRGAKFIANDGYYGNYMMKNQSLKNKVKKTILPYATRLKKGQSLNINIVTSMEIENGEDMIGYQYLHGTNANAGGFTIKGTISKDKIGNVIYDLTYTWNDIIDPNFIYDSDSKKAAFAKTIPLAHPKDYKLSISWRDVTTIKAYPAWLNWNTGWLS